MERFFNTAGPNRPDEQYTVDPLTRIDLDEILMLIRQKKYFVLHAPRQTGKTSCMLSLRDYLNQRDEYIAVYANVEDRQASRNDVQSVVKSTVDTLAEEARLIIKNATEGQPWLVNALGYEVTMRMKENRDRSVRIIPEMIYRAQEQIIYRRETHIDILIDKLKEPRVKRVIEPILANSEEADESVMSDEDILYVKDIGLVTKEFGKPIRIANAIYREIIPRELTISTQEQLPQNPSWYMNPDNSINMERLLLDFQQFFRQNSDSWIGKFDYVEAGPQLLLQAFLQRIVNGGGYIDREYGLGHRRTDLLIRKPLTGGYGGPIQRVVLELKIKRGSLEAVIEEGLRQTSDYMDITGPIDEGHLIIFDRSNTKTWDDRIWHQPHTREGKAIMAWGM